MTSDNVVGFPPRPRGWQGLIEQVVVTLAERPDGGSWHPVQIRGLVGAWVGVHCASLGDVGRPWVWDVVTTHDRDELPILRSDPLTLAVDQDMVVVAIRRDDEPATALHVQVPVSAVPDQVEIPGRVLPPSPWRLELSTGWSTAAIGNALTGWVTEWVGGSASVLPPTTDGHEVGEDCLQVGEELWASATAFDTLLERDPRDAAMMTGCLSAVVEALEPWRRRAA